MKFIKKTLLPLSKSSINISVLSPNKESTQEGSSKYLQQELHSEYEELKSSLKNINHLPKYLAYLESFQSILDVKKNMLNKKFQTLMTSLNFSGKKKEKQIPLLEAFMELSPVQRYKFLIDLIKNVQQHQKSIEKNKTQPHNSPSKKKEQAFDSSRVKIFSQASISLNELKTLSLSYWTKVEFELNCQQRELRVSGKQSFILYLQNYLVRVSKNQKNCLVLLCCNPEQVPSWLRKVYIQIKKEIFVEAFQSIWNEIVLIQLQKMEASFEEVKDVETSPTKSMASSSANEEQSQIDKEAYSLFLTPISIRSYMSEKAKFTSKIRNKLKFSLYKEIQFDSAELQSIKQKLQKISFLKAFDEKNKEIYQVKGHFNIPASVVKFKFINSLKERNKFISSWEILENQPDKCIQAISQSFDFSDLFSNQSISLDPRIFSFKQLSLKQEASDFANNEITQVLVLQSIREISKTSVTNFLIVDCDPKKHEKSELTITFEFNKHLIRRKIHKLKIDTISKEKVGDISKKLIQNFMKEMIMMIFTQQKNYEQIRIQDQQEFFTICEAFDNDVDELDIFSTKSIQIQEEVADIQFNNENQDAIQVGVQRYSEGSPNKTNKSNSLNNEEASKEHHFAKKKSLSLQFERQLYPQRQNLQKQERIQQGPKDPNAYLKTVFAVAPKQKTLKPQLVKNNLLAEEWLRLDEGGLTCINEAKIKQQKKIIKKILVKLGQTILKQKNIMHVSLPVTIFKTESQLTTVTRGLTYAPLLLEPQCYTSNDKASSLQRMKNTVVFLISNSYSQINFEKPFNPILGQTVQYWIDGCPVYFEQISHHPPITSYLMVGRGYKIFGSMQPSLSMGINHAKVISHCIDHVEFDDGTKMNAGANKMLVDGTTFGMRTFNLNEKNYVYDLTNNLLALFSYGPTKKGLFSTSSEPSDFIKGRVTKMSDHFRNSQYAKWKKSDYSLKKQWIERQVSVFEGIWSKKVFFDGEEYFNFDTQLPFELIPEANPLPSDSRYRQDLQWLIKGDLDKSQQYKERMEEDQRYDKKLRTKNR